MICTGAYEPSWTLELSGIGDPQVLQAAGLDCTVANKLVGANLQDHYAMAISFELVSGRFSVNAVLAPEVIKPFMELYQKAGTGPLAGPPSGIGYLNYAVLVSPEQLQTTLYAAASTQGIETPLNEAQQRQNLQFQCYWPC
ncbi:uncharacterized protein Z519_12594 [Cladophialophora bantiana CBS 173.52]|uniref:Glucose-methanol-choline oxidoreductase N-terminal domain-containing protein n=1 Tax=Cladophialophora bantiana (strain ATCC 10958 / CBS 173.52 / CDC B-1940 / NIH 8579) TaxID=1442370 RepID=A0A0D2H0K2_CLAB1|nr:uncharacterized protein Z519_12594 [Cladophialophora bantiana CBS 173.52]KIW86808.1 hypothetical protein Z519_12594 [Cladophialophora bantiana CBS 173.52]